VIKLGGPRLGSSQDDVPTAASTASVANRRPPPSLPLFGVVVVGSHACRCAVNTVRTRPRAQPPPWGSVRARKPTDRARSMRTCRRYAARTSPWPRLPPPVGRWKFGAIGISKPYNTTNASLLYIGNVCVVWTNASSSSTADDDLVRANNRDGEILKISRSDDWEGVCRSVFRRGFFFRTIFYFTRCAPFYARLSECVPMSLHRHAILSRRAGRRTNFKRLLAYRLLFSLYFWPTLNSDKVWQNSLTQNITIFMGLVPPVLKIE